MDSLQMVTKRICMEVPLIVNSMGFNKRSQDTITGLLLPQLQAQLLVIFIANSLCHFVLKHIGATSLASQFVAGIILGPNLLGRNEWFKKVLFAPASQRSLSLLGHFTFMLFMFLKGVQMDMSMVNRTGRKAFVIGFTSVLTPLILSVVAAGLLRDSLVLNKLNHKSLLFVVPTQAMTSFPVVASLLAELKILNSEIGRLALSAGLTSDICMTVVLYIVKLSFVHLGQSPVEAQSALVSYIAFIFIVFFIFRPAMFWIIKQTPEGKPVREQYTFSILLVVFFFVGFANRFVKFGIIGTFILGLAVPAGPPLGSSLEKQLELLVSRVLLPSVATTAAMRVDFSNLSPQSNFTTLNLAIIVVTFVPKLIACFTISKCCQMPIKDAAVIALLMSSKGIVEIMAYAKMRDYMMFPDSSYNLLAISIMLNSIVLPILARCLYDPCRKYAGYQKRNVMNLKQYDEFKILTCIQRPENVTASINLIDVIFPSENKPICVYILHLIEQIGRASPIFISHQLHKRSDSISSSAKSIILSFENYQMNNRKGLVSTNVFTAVSPSDTMHEDICYLALDRLINLIVLPFHKKWSTDGVIEYDCNRTRAINWRVLEKAPCSVGILVDHGRMGQPASLLQPQTIFYVAMIFIGGSDDQEALTVAKQVAKNPGVHLTVVHLLAADDNETNNWNKKVNLEVLKDVTSSEAGYATIKYLEISVKNGTDTASVVQSLAGFDLFIVGRRYGIRSPQTEALSEWSEFPELGDLGDLLTSYELNSRTSVLVVQQQLTVQR